jgi:thiamine biosynthesis protein ThiS
MTNRASDPQLDRAPDEALAFQIVVNGERRPTRAGATVGDLLRGHGLDPRTVVVERNRVILRDRAAFDSLALAPGDTIEIVHFVGGG